MGRGYCVATLVLPVILFGLVGCPPTPLEAGDEANFAGIRFVWCPPGSFMMGQEAPASGGDVYWDVEVPVHQVTFEKGFWIAKFETTQKQWRDVTGEAPSHFTGDNRPVESVSLEDIDAFIAALNAAHPKLNFRLPSEAEWEYACRAGTTTRYYWGDDLTYSQIQDNVWYDENSGNQTHDVGQKLPNAWGLHDMSGNVWESVPDRYHPNYIGAPSDGSAWMTGTLPGRVVRGGAYNYLKEHCQSPSHGTYSGIRSDSGFRLAKF